ncbi:MAG: hypothetical protein R3F39_14665 [Myxococcota bacterium]
MHTLTLFVPRWLAAAAFLVSVALGAACQETLPIHTSGVLWRCASNADCNASTFCGPQNICLPKSAVIVQPELPDVPAPDVAVPDTSPDSGPDMVAPDTTEDTETVVVPHDDNPYSTTDATTGFVSVDGVRHPILLIVPFGDQAGGYAIALRYDCNPDVIEMQVSLDAPWPGGKPTGAVRLVRWGGEAYETASATVSSDSEWNTGSGSAVQVGGGATVAFEFRASRSKDTGVAMRFGDSGAASLAENEVLLDGKFTNEAFLAFQHLIAEHPKIDTVVFGCWFGLGGGSLQVIGNQLRQRGFNTRIRAGSYVSSGWLFIAGKERILDPGVTLLAEGKPNDPAAAIFETGPWVDLTFGNVVTNDKYPCPSHQVHEFELPYFRNMLGTTEGEAFYCWTLEDEFNNRVTAQDLEPFGVFTSK